MGNPGPTDHDDDADPRPEDRLTVLVRQRTGLEIDADALRHLVEDFWPSVQQCAHQIRENYVARRAVIRHERKQRKM